MTYTLPLALVDFLPILFSALGMFFVSRMAGRWGRALMQMATAGAVLIITGGLFKAIWKTIMAVTNGTVDVRWMDEGLFVWMAPGFVLMAWAMWGAAQGAQNKSLKLAWPVPLGIIVVMFLASGYLALSRPDAPTWSRVLLGVMVLATVAVSVLLIILSIRLKMPLMAGLFLLNLVGVFILNGLARIDEQTITLQWIEESINTVSWLAFAVAAWKLHRITHAA
jgi:hypothetical protein